MSERARLRIGTFGVPAFEQQVLGRIFVLSKTRPYCYELRADAEDGSGLDIALVDYENVAAVHAWEQRQDAAGIPVVPIVTRKRNADELSVQRPFMATRVLSVLDRIAAGAERPSGAAETAAPPTAAPEPAARPDPRPDPRSGTVPDRRSGPRSDPRSDPRLNLRADLGPAPSAGTGSDAAPAPRAASDSRYRALVVDDSLAVRKQIGKALEQAEIVAEFADSGGAALAQLGSHRYDIVFLDVVMPEMDGYEVCRQIKRSRDKKHIPVVMLTGKSSPFDRVKGKLSGCNAYLTKPVSRREFADTLGRYLKQPILAE